MKNIRTFGWLGLLSVAVIIFIGLLAIASVSPATATVSASAMFFAFGLVSTEGNRLGDVVFHESDREASREAVTVLSGQNLLIGTVLGKITKAIAAPVAGGGNTGNGTVTGYSLGAKAKLGTYTLKCITAAVNGGTFAVISPDGDALPNASVGVGYINDQINFTINDGTTDFIVGDSFTIAVDAGSGKVKILTPAAVDGTQNAYGALTADVDASAADLAGVAIVRDAILKDTGLVWPGGITAGQKAAALAELESEHITTRTAQ